MLILRAISVAAVVVCMVGCGASSDGSTDPNGSSGTISGSGKTLTATFNGADFKPNLMTAVYNAGTVAINANDGGHSLLINGLGVSAPGTYSFAPGNANSLLGQWIDSNAGTYSTGFTGGTGTITFTVLQVGRVAGSFNFVTRGGVTTTTAAQNVTLVGTFDIKFP